MGPSLNSSVRRPFVSACVMCLLLGLPNLSIAALSRRVVNQGKVCEVVLGTDHL